MDCCEEAGRTDRGWQWSCCVGLWTSLGVGRASIPRRKSSNMAFLNLCLLSELNALQHTATEPYKALCVCFIHLDASRLPYSHHWRTRLYHHCWLDFRLGMPLPSSFPTRLTGVSQELPHVLNLGIGSTPDSNRSATANQCT